MFGSIQSYLPNEATLFKFFGLEPKVSTHGKDIYVQYKGYKYATFNTLKLLLNKCNPLDLFNTALKVPGQSEDNQKLYSAVSIDLLDLNWPPKKTYVVSSSLVLNKQLLDHENNTADGPVRGGKFYANTKDITDGDNIITCSSEMHKKLVGFANPFFRPDEANSRSTVFGQIAQNILENCLDKSSVNITKLLPEYTSQCILRALLGYEGKIAGLAEAIQEMTELTYKRMHGLPTIPLSLNRRYQNGLKIFAKLIDAVYELAENNKSDCFITAMIKAKNKDDSAKFTKEQIISMIKVIAIAGQETTSSLLERAVHSLALYPEWQEKLYAELLTFSKSSSLENAEGIKDLCKLTELDHFLSEVLRMHPPALGQAREIQNEPYALFEDLKLEIGTLVITYHVGSQMNNEVWEKPEEFNPDRFNGPYNCSGFTTVNKMIPFGKGSNACLGKFFAEREAKVMMAELILKYEVKFFGKPSSIKVKPGFALSLEEPVNVTLIPRNF